MSEMWRRFGFDSTPYRTTPLDVTEQDAKLFVGRSGESARFLTAMDTDDGCVVVLSGDAGVGKTSFLNVHQYWLSKSDAPWSKSLVPSFEHVSLRKHEAGQEDRLAHRIVLRAVQNIDRWCGTENKKLPKMVRAIKDWLSHVPDQTGVSVGLNLGGIGGLSGSKSVSVPSPANATLENWQEVLTIVASECRATATLDMDGMIVCLDNAESLDIEVLGDLLMSLRDTLFAAKGVWWIVIGQSRLLGMLTAQDSRVAERIRGGIEIPPMDGRELTEMIDERVKVYRSSRGAVSPLSKAIHEHLFEASRGVARFVLKTADKTIDELVSSIRKSVQSSGGLRAAPEVLDEVLDEAFNKMLFEDRIHDRVICEVLLSLVTNTLGGMSLSDAEIGILESVGVDELTIPDLSKRTNQSEEDFRALLGSMVRRNLLQMRTIGGEDRYRLKYHAFLCAELGGFERMRELALDEDR